MPEFHLNPLRRCRDCESPATDELRNGYNAVQDVYCKRHGPAALRRANEAAEQRRA